MPSEVEGVLVEKRFNVDDVVTVGQTLAIIETSADVVSEEPIIVEEPIVNNEVLIAEATNTIATVEEVKEAKASVKNTADGRFYSPLVKTIAKKENVSQKELDTIIGTGKDSRVTKYDILDYIEKRGSAPIPVEVATPKEAVATPVTPEKVVKQSTTPVSVNGEDEIIEMTRMGKLISKYMVESVQTSAHVQSFIEIDVTNIVKWREKVKDAFFKREGEKITYTPILMQAVAATIKKFPMVNISVDGDKIIKRKHINLGMAAALDDGNLIVPVIKNADQLNLVGMTNAVNDLARRAKGNQLKPDEIQGGTYTVTNVGSFGSVMGTPIINQPQVAILALGAIRKVPAVIETSEGDFIGIRHKMFVSHSYDHRVVNGALGGMFIKTLKETLEAWDVNADF